MAYPTRTRTARDKRYDFRGTAKWKRTRLAVLKRDGYRCHWQGPACLGVGNQADHVVPVSHGGPLYDMDNLVASCGPCNRARPVAPVHNESRVHRVVHVYAEGGVRFSEDGQTLYAHRANLSPLSATTASGGYAARRYSHQNGTSRAKSADASGGLARDYTRPGGAYSSDDVHTHRMDGPEAGVIVRDYTRKGGDGR